MSGRWGLSRKGLSPAKGRPVLMPFEVSGWGWSTGHLKGPIDGAGTRALWTRLLGAGQPLRALGHVRLLPGGFSRPPTWCVSAHGQEQADRSSHLESGLVESTRTEGLTLTSRSLVSPSRAMFRGPLCSAEDVSVQGAGHEACPGIGSSGQGQTVPRCLAQRPCDLIDRVRLGRSLRLGPTGCMFTACEPLRAAHLAAGKLQAHGRQRCLVQTAGC